VFNRDYAVVQGVVLVRPRSISRSICSPMSRTSSSIRDYGADHGRHGFRRGADRETLGMAVESPSGRMLRRLLGARVLCWDCS